LVAVPEGDVGAEFVTQPGQIDEEDAADGLGLLDRKSVV
jgi:hypothetical protein